VGCDAAALKAPKGISHEFCDEYRSLGAIWWGPAEGPSTPHPAPRAALTPTPAAHNSIPWNVPANSAPSIPPRPNAEFVASQSLCGAGYIPVSAQCAREQVFCDSGPCYCVVLADYNCLELIQLIVELSGHDPFLAWVGDRKRLEIYVFLPSSFQVNMSH
jgi:hypothetical protein